MAPPHVNYSLYLVTDSTPALLRGKDLCAVVDAAIRGGVTVVQYRDKTSDTGVLIATAKRLHAITSQHKVPLLINDRVDVALAVGCEGVHLGQDDMDIGTARALLGPDKIIGISANSVDEAGRACQQGANYLGLGTVFSTQTKKNSKSIIGTGGLSRILNALVVMDYGDLPTVCIGGINATNITQVMFRGRGARKAVDGVAVVSAIVAADDPESAARSLRQLVRQELMRNSVDFTLSVVMSSDVVETQAEGWVLESAMSVVQKVGTEKPLSHNMTNLVVQNFAANVALAVGASPIMANCGEEAADLAALGGALVINMGTVTPEGLENYKKALRAYNAAKRPVVFDPVGAGATAVRRAAVKDILSTGYVDVIKGNESEIRTVLDSSGGEAQRGVDSSSTLSDYEKAQLVIELATRESNVVVMTGKTDFVSDGYRTFTIANGHEYLGMVTGTGCTLGTTISAMVAAQTAGGEDGDKLMGTIAGILLFEIAAELAAQSPAVHGPGSFVPAFLDALYQLRTQKPGGAYADGDRLGWLRRAKINQIQ